MSKTKKTATKQTSTSTKTSDPNLVPLSEAMPKATTKGKRAAATKATKTAKPTKETKEKKLSALDAAAQVLKASSEPMTCKAMIEATRERKLWTSTAPTPHATLSSAILREMTNKKRDSRFKKTGRGLFAFNQPA